MGVQSGGMKKNHMFLRSRVSEVELGLCRKLFFSYNGKEDILNLKNSLDAYSYSPVRMKTKQI
jgi:hypothetical protein